MIAVARTSITMLNNSGESGHPCLVPDLRGGCFQFFTIENNVCCRLIIYGIYYVEVGSFYARFFFFFWRVLIINRCWILSKAFSASIEIIIWFLSFNLLIWYITLIDVEESLHPWNKSQFDHGVWAFGCVAEFCLLKFCWGFLHLFSSVILACSFCVCVFSLFGFGIRVMVVS